MGTVHGNRRDPHLESVTTSEIDLRDDDNDEAVRDFEVDLCLPKIRDPGDGAEDPPEMSSSNLKLHVVHGSDSTQQIDDVDIDSYLDDALDELDDTVAPDSANSPLSRPRRNAPPPPPQRTRSRDSVRSSVDSSRPGSGVVSTRSGDAHRRGGTGSSSGSLSDERRRHRSLSNQKTTSGSSIGGNRAMSKREATRAAVVFAQQSRAFEATTTGDLGTLQRLLLDSTTEFSPLTRDSHGSTLLHRAAEAGQTACLEWLVTRCSVDALHVRDADFATPGLLATINGHVGCVKVLIEADGGVIARYDKGVTLLHHAAYYAQEECLVYLLARWKEKKYQAEDLKDDAGATPAHIAARNGSLPCLKAMVEAQINMTQEDMNGQTPVDWANGANQKMCAHYLLLVDSCQTLSATVSKLQGQITRSREENQYLKAQLTEASRSKEMMEQELREEYDESVEEVRKEYVDMTVKLMEKLEKKTQSDSAAEELAEKLTISEARASRSEAETRQLTAKLEEAYEKINLLTDMLEKRPRSTRESDAPAASKMMLHEQRGRARTSKSRSPVPAPRLDGWESVYEAKRGLRGQSWSTGASSNTLHSSGSSLEI
ncbi:synphilin-1-like isoform X2 [Oscarella lobularis]|uniref:synphilin-1-like isoform X2 n=1 Tax=Oscarella lobularis TaxID=121494 RepID=UPI0033140B6E